MNADLHPPSMSGAVWHNAVRPKLLMAGYHVAATQAVALPCPNCAARQRVQVSWRVGASERVFVSCPECDRVVELVAEQAAV